MVIREVKGKPTPANQESRRASVRGARFLNNFERLFQKPRIVCINNNFQPQLILMKNQNLRLYAISVSAALLIDIPVAAYPQQIGVPDTGNGAWDQLVQLGDTAFFSVNAVKGGSYQWLRNGAAIFGQTNSTLVINSTQINDAGYYSCNIANGAAVTPTISASLQVYTMDSDWFGVVVYAQPIVSSGSQWTCPGPYTGYVTYTKTVAQGWGWTPSTNTTIYTASDTTRTNTKVEYGGDYGDEGCAQTTVTIPNPPFSPLYRFAIYFTNNVPTTNYPITLSGFNP
jgi:hypothetical protein